jgi:mRNA interferase YafQ
MLIVRPTKQFKKDYKLAIKRGWDVSKLDHVIGKLAHGEVLPAKYKDHALQGNWKGCRDCHIQGDWVLLYEITATHLILHATGTHSDWLD